jgi:hypothetical protein
MASSNGLGTVKSLKIGISNAAKRLNEMKVQRLSPMRAGENPAIRVGPKRAGESPLNRKTEPLTDNAEGESYSLFPEFSIHLCKYHTQHSNNVLR